MQKTITQTLMDKSQLSSEKIELDRVAHWENVYSSKQTTEVSWFEAEPTTSLTRSRQIYSAVKSRDAVNEVHSAVSCENPEGNGM